MRYSVYIASLLFTALAAWRVLAGDAEWRWALAGFGLLALVVAIGIVVTNRGSSPVGNVTIADLRSDPDHYDNRSVILTGTVDDVRQLPMLDQYALYTFRDDTGSMWALTQKGIPPRDGESVELTAVYHSRVKLDDQIKAIVEQQIGSLAGSIVGGLLPGVALNVVFLEHESYTMVEE